MGGDYPPDPLLALRSASPSESGCLSALARAAMPDDPSWHYLFPHRLHHSDDHNRWHKRVFDLFFAQPDRYAVDVVVAADNGGGPDVPIAWAVWVLDDAVPETVDDLGVPFNPSQPARRADVHLDHFDAFRRQMPAADRAFFAEHGAARLRLLQLGTHPTFRHRGAASMLVRAGISRSHDLCMPITTLASILGHRLYVRHGFRTLGGFLVQANGDSDHVRFAAMEYRPAGLDGGDEIDERSSVGSSVDGSGSEEGRRSPFSIEDIDFDSMRITLKLEN